MVAALYLMIVLVPLCLVVAFHLIRLPFRIFGGIHHATRAYSWPTRVCAYVFSRVIRRLCREGTYGRVVLTGAFALLVGANAMTVTAPYMKYFFGYNPWGYISPVPVSVPDIGLWSLLREIPPATWDVGRSCGHYALYGLYFLGVLVGCGLTAGYFWRHRYYHMRHYAEITDEDTTLLQIDLWFRFSYFFRAVLWSALFRGLGYAVDRLQLLPPFGPQIPPLWPLVFLAFAVVSIHHHNQVARWSKFLGRIRSEGRDALDREYEAFSA